MTRCLVSGIAMAIIAIGIAIPTANAEPKPMYQCLNNTHVWDKRQCPENRTGPAGFPGAGGGGGRGGLLGAIGDLLGGRGLL